MGSIVEHYKTSWGYIVESRNYVLIVVLVFLFSALIALYYQPPEIVELIREFLEQILEQTEGMSTWKLVVFILNNNLRSSFFGMILGIVFGIFPVLTAFSNGYVLGFVLSKAVIVEGLSVLWKLVPHGIFELPALFLSLALGTKLGLFWFAAPGKRKQEFLRRLQESLRIFLFIILPLLIIAAIIEGILINVLG